MNTPTPSSERDEQTLEDQRSDEYSDKVAELEKYFMTHLMPAYEGRQRIHNLAFEAYKNGRADADHQTQIAQVRYALKQMQVLLDQAYEYTDADDPGDDYEVVSVQDIKAAIQTQQTLLDELTKGGRDEAAR